LHTEQAKNGAIKVIVYVYNPKAASGKTTLATAIALRGFRYAELDHNERIDGFDKIVRFTDIVSLLSAPFSFRSGARVSVRRRELHHAPVMFGEGLVDAPFTVPNSLFRFVVGTFHLLRERCDFA